jgi:energy-coupling factor transporter ATP-binding protein EcfA2
MTTIYASGHAIPKVDDSKLFFVNRLTILYGPSATGKSTLIQHILNSVRETIPLGIVCCPTATLNGDYTNILPDQCVYDDVTRPLMQKIFQRQTNVMAMYDIVRDVDVLRPIFDLVADSESSTKASRLSSIYKKGCADIRSTYDEQEVDAVVDELTAKYNKKLVKIMRAVINANIAKLQSRPLTEMQRTVVTNININPRLFLLIDDCMATVNEWSKMEETKKLFFQARHYFISVMIAAQGDTLIPPQLRTNAHISIFTTQAIVNTYINKASSGIPPDQRKTISKIAETIFAASEDKSRPNYKKMVIFGPIVPTESKIQYIIGTIRKQKFGSSAFWRLCDEVKRESSAAANSTSFAKMFAMKTAPSLESIP